MAKRAYSDPAFVAEMNAIREQRHLAFAKTAGTGLPIDEAGRPVKPNDRLTLNNDKPIGTTQSTFRPSGKAW